MPINSHSDGSIIATGPDGIAYYTLCAAISVAKLQAKGLRHSNPRVTVKNLCINWNISPRVQRWEKLAEILEERRKRFLADPDKKVSILTHGQ